MYFVILQIQAWLGSTHTKPAQQELRETVSFPREFAFAFALARCLRGYQCTWS